MNRRGFLGAILAVGVAPAVVRASSLMKVSGIQVATLEETFLYTTYPAGLFGNELAAICRRAFTPGLVSAIYQKNPLLQALGVGAQWSDEP